MIRYKSYGWFVFFCITLLVVGFFIGYNINIDIDDGTVDNSNHNISMNPDNIYSHLQSNSLDTANASKNENTVIPVDFGEQKQRVLASTKMVFEQRYLQCGHITSEEAQVPEELVNMTEEDLKDIFPEWELKVFNKESIDFIKNIDGKCLKHYILKEYNGIIGVFYQSSSAENLLKQIIEINIEHLREDDREKLKKGIYVESDRELAQLIEDFTS